MTANFGSLEEKMNYTDLIKRAFNLTLRNRFLWIFGFFVVTAGVWAASIALLTFGGSNKVQAESVVNITKDQAVSFFNQYAFPSLIGVLILLVIAIVMFVLALISRGALINGADKLGKGEKSDFSSAFKIGKKYFWHLWAVAIVYSLVVMASIMSVITPIVMGIFFVFFLPIAVLWSLLTFPLVLIINIAIIMILPFVYRAIIIEDKGVKDGILLAFRLFKRRFIDIIVLNLVLVISEIFYSMFAMLALALIAVVLFLIGVIIWTASLAIGIVFSFMAGALLVVCLFMLTSAFFAFQSVIVTLAYDKLKA